MTILKIETLTQLTTALEAVQTKRKDWEAGAFAASNDKLYAILSAAYDVCQACIANPDLTDGITDLLKLHGLQHSSNTSLELKVVRLVFADRDTQSKYKFRLLSYARVLNLAQEDRQTPATLAQYIKDKGGIDEIRRTVSSNDKEQDAKDYTAVAKKNLSDPQYMGLFDAFPLPPELKPENGSRYSLALIRDNQDGTGTIIRGLKTNTLVEKALEETGKTIADEVARKATRDLLDGTNQHQSTLQQQAAAAVSSAFKPGLSIGQPVSAAE
jgi:hypothetical protein